jgi:tRNA(Ile)-lysidine synthase TilS/MesJ
MRRYAYFKRLDYFSTECIYSPNAYRGFARTYLKDLESIRPSAIIDIIHSGEQLAISGEVKVASQREYKCRAIRTQAGADDDVATFRHLLPMRLHLL